MEGLLQLFANSFLLVTNSEWMLRMNKKTGDKEMKTVRVSEICFKLLGISFLAFSGDNYCPLLIRVRNSPPFSACDSSQSWLKKMCFDFSLSLLRV